MTGATPSRLHQGQPTQRAGQPLGEAGAAMILIHGRGATAESILELAGYLPHPAMTYLAPQAAGQTWYPYSFLARCRRTSHICLRRWRGWATYWMR